MLNRITHDRPAQAALRAHRVFSLLAILAAVAAIMAGLADSAFAEEAAKPKLDSGDTS